MADEYISREAVLSKSYSYLLPNGDYSPQVVFASSIKSIPSADVVEVVRCKDCKHYNRRYYELSGKYYGTFCDLYHYGFKADFYCAQGERREIGHD